jgi:hypothetical protein
MDMDIEEPEEHASDAGPEGASTEPESAGPGNGPGGPRDDDGAARRVEIGVVEGDVLVRGVDGPQVRINAHDFDDADDERVQPGEAAGGVLRFARLSGHAELLVPRGVTVSLRRVDGYLIGEELSGRLEAGSVAGDATVIGVAAADLGRVEGDLVARACGALRVREVDGDVRLDELREVAELGRVGDDLQVYQVAGLQAREAIGGDVRLEGSAGDAYLRGPVGGDVQVSACAGELRIGSVGGDLSVRLCRAVAIDGAIGGDCDVAEIAGGVEVHGAVGGDLSASLVGGLTVGGAVGSDADLATIARAARLRTVGGDLEADGIAGPLIVGTVGGDAEVRTCLGALQINTVGGDLTVQRATGGVAVTRAGGDVELDTPLVAGAEYQVRAAGDIRLRVWGEVNARFVAQTHGGEIHTRLPLAVERGRRRNLVGVLGRGDAAVTLNSDGGDITIVGVYGNEEETMSDEFGATRTDAGDAGQATGTSGNPRSWEGNFGGHKFRVHWDPGAASAPDNGGGSASPRRGFAFEWAHDPAEDRKAAEDFERRMNDLRDKAEQAARRAAEQAQRYAERAARRARETDWEAVGREVRSAIERAMGELEGTVNQLRRDFETRRSTTWSGSSGTGSSATGAQRVRIEQDEAGETAEPATAAPDMGAADVEGRRRAILEDLRAGIISIDEAERRLGELR